MVAQVLLAVARVPARGNRGVLSGTERASAMTSARGMARTGKLSVILSTLRRGPTGNAASAYLRLLKVGMCPAAPNWPGTVVPLQVNLILS